MILKHPYWFFKDVIPHHVCDLIVKDCLNRKAKKGLVGNQSNDDLKHVMSTRDSNIVFVNEPWIHNLIQPYIRTANKNAGWNFQLGLPEEIQFTVYNKNQFYDWHSDSFPEPFKNGYIRKISSTLLLNDSSEFKGGEFWFSIEEDRKVCEELNSKGSLVVFPSFIRHKIAPITKGTRYSMVTWNNGDPWK